MAVDWTYWPSDPEYAPSGYWDWRPPWIRPSRPGSILWAAKCTVAPTIEPMTLGDVKTHLRVDMPDDDALITNLIQAAREYIEMRTGLSLLTQTWVLQLDRFPRVDRIELWPQAGLPLGCILLPRRPVQSVTGITWTDVNGNVSAVDPTTYTVDLISEPARIMLTSIASWPEDASPGIAMMAGVQVTFVAGNTATTLIPSNLKTAFLLMVGHWYLNREEVLSGSRLVAIQMPVAADELLWYATRPMVG